MSKTKKLLTLDDLYSCFSGRKKSFNFDSSKSNQEICVQVDGNLKFGQSSDTEGLLPVVLQSCHTEKNLNGSEISEEVMNNALNTFKNRPILGYIHEVDGQYEFYGHNMHLDEDDNLVYDEIPVGIIPESCDARLEYDEDKGKTYCVVNGYIFEEYTKASEILQREKECAVSVELCIRKMSYNAKEKSLVIEDFYFSGVTILGKNEDGDEVKPGMEKSNIKLADFSVENNSLFSNEEINLKLVDTLERLNNTLESFNINNPERKEENQVDIVENFEEEVTEEVVEEVIEEVVEEVTEEITEEVTEETTENEVTETEEVTETVDETPEETVEETTEEVEDEAQFSKQFEVRFEISHDEVRYALYNLISQFEELDNDYYYIRAVYDSHFVMQGWCSGDIYGCKYTKDGDNIALDGERYKLYEELLTESEKSQLDEMRSNYSAIQEKLNRYEKAELDAQKDAVFADESYAEYLEDDEFKSLIDNKDNYSVDELKDKAEIAFAKCVKKAGNFSAKTTEVKSKRHGLFAAEKVEEKKPYGGLFD